MDSTKDPQGLSLVSVLVGLAILSAGMLLLAQSLATYFVGYSRVEGSPKVNQIFAAAVNELQDVSFDDLVKLCQSKRMFGNAPLAGRCVLAGPPPTVNRNPVPLPGPIGQPALARIIEIPRGAAGPLASNQLKRFEWGCIELTGCRTLAEGHLLEVTMQGHWEDPDPNIGVARKSFQIRRTRW